LFEGYKSDELPGLTTLEGRGTGTSAPFFELPAQKPISIINQN